MIVGKKVYHRKKIFNSLKWAQDEISTAPDGSVFLADIHEHTKGRGERVWQFDKDQLAVTILFKPDIFSKFPKQDISLSLNLFNMATCLGILDPLKSFSIGIKWPNDFYYGKSKVAGMLLRPVWQAGLLNGLILGFAVNVNNKTTELNNLIYSAKSLKSILGRPLDKRALLKNLLKSIDNFYLKWLQGDWETIFLSWKENLLFLKSEINVHHIDGQLISGIFEDVMPNGDLILSQKDKKVAIPNCVVEDLFFL